jgi:hypothetical protein
MPQTNADAEIRALQAVIEALEPLDDEARSRVLDYTLRRLGMRELSTLSSLSAHAPEPSPQPEINVPKPSQLTDIRSLREAKQPSSAVEMAAVVAYYLSEAAPADERQEAVTTADLEKYFKQANYRLPTRIATTLNNAAAAGYFDRAARGEYRLNPVGFNLVTQTLPRATGEAPRRAPTRKKATARTRKAKTSAENRTK